MTPQTSRSSGLPTLRRLLGALAVAGALVVALPAVASAGSWSYADPKGDVVTQSIDDEQTVASPNRKAGDVWRTAVSHTRDNVVIRITMQAVPSADWMAFTTIRTPRTSFDLTQFKFGGARGLYLSKTNGDGDEVPCRSKSSRMIGTAIQLVVSRRCLGYPSTVRVGAGIMVVGDEKVHADDALRRGVGDALRLSPLIRRG